MSLALQVFLAFIFDLILGDPRGYTHPVKIIARLAYKLESLSRSLISNKKMAGLVTTFLVVTITFSAVYLIIALLNSLHIFAGTLVSIFYIYTSLSIRSLIDESLPVYKFLKEHNLPEARKRLANIVGRDTQNLNEEEIARAAVETIAESTVDGIIAPLFFAIIGGAPLALAYKAVSTMDSLFGYKNEKYIDFGWASARLDDLANWLPARLAIPTISAGAALCGFSGSKAWKTAFRDGNKHPSPNAGISEAAIAGALGIQLGGTSYYSGIQNNKPLLGEAIRKTELNDIINSQKIMFTSASLALALLAGLHQLLMNI